MSSTTMQHLKWELFFLTKNLVAFDLPGARLNIWSLRRKLAEGLATDAAWLLPKRVAYWATIRLGAHATIGLYGNTNPSELLYMDVLKRAEQTFLPKVLRRDVMDGGELGDVIVCWQCEGRKWLRSNSEQGDGKRRCPECSGTGELHRLKTLPPLVQPEAAE